MAKKKKKSNPNKQGGLRPKDMTPGQRQLYRQYKGWKKVSGVSGTARNAARPTQSNTTPAAPAAPVTDGGDANVNPPTTTNEDTLAYQELRRFLIWAGLPPDMTDFIQGKINDGTLSDDAGVEDYVMVAVDHPSFQARFPVIVEQFKRRSAGNMSVQIMTPAEVLDYETQVRNVADDYGLSGWVSSPDQISTLILNDVDVDEAKERINLAGYAAQTASKTFREAFMGRFGLTEGNLVGYFLDPNKEEGEIRKQVTLGNVMGAALANGFGNDWRTAETLYDRGFIPAGDGVVAQDTFMSDFARAALTQGLSSGLGGTVSEQDRITAAFGDVQSAQRVANVAAQRQGRFNRSGGAAESQTGVAGLGSASRT